MQGKDSMHAIKTLKEINTMATGRTSIGLVGSQSRGVLKNYLNAAMVKHHFLLLLEG